MLGYAEYALIVRRSSRREDPRNELRFKRDGVDDMRADNPMIIIPDFTFGIEWCVMDDLFDIIEEPIA